MKIFKSILCASLIMNLSACSSIEQTKSGLNPENFVAERDGKMTGLYTISNQNGMEVCLTNYGGRIVSVMVPDRNGEFRDVVLGFDNINDYLKIANNFGATIGRYGNRIADGMINIEGKEIQLPRNNFGHCLHGGPQGWDSKILDVKVIDGQNIEMSVVSPDGDANFPGTVKATVRFTVTDDNALKLSYTATTDKTTIINLTNHSYFNLNGRPDLGVLDHMMYLNAEGYTPIDSTFMTTGEIAQVEGTPMDFREAKTIGRDINADFQQLRNGRGYDHNWVLATERSLDKVAAKVWSEESGIQLEVYTDEPGIQVYTGNFLDGTITGKNGLQYIRRASVCLETQHYPDSPNKPEWPSVIVRPGETYTSTCIYKFTTK